MTDRDELSCPACSEMILATAKKCKHCGEWLAGSKPSAYEAQPPVSSLSSSGQSGAPVATEPHSPREGQGDSIVAEGTGLQNVPVTVSVNGFRARLTSGHLVIQGSSVGVLGGNVETFDLRNVRGISTELDEASQSRKMEIVTRLDAAKWALPLLWLAPFATGAWGLIFTKGAIKVLISFLLGVCCVVIGLVATHFNKKQLEALRPMRFRVRLADAVREFALPDDDAQAMKAVHEFVAEVQRKLSDRGRMNTEGTENALLRSRQPAVSSGGDALPVVTEEQRRQLEMQMLEAQKQLEAAQNGDVTSNVLMAVAGVFLLFALASFFSSPSTSGVSYERSQAVEQERTRNLEDARTRARVACGQEAFVGATKAQTERCLDRADRLR